MIAYIAYAILAVWCLKGLFLWLRRPCNSKACLVGKTAIVTGGNRGIGFQIALGLAARGCKVILACRGTADRAKEDIIQQTNNSNVVIRHLDLNSFKSVREFSKKIHETEEKIDILINNAGVLLDLDTNIPTEDGAHRTLQTNLYSPFLLINLLTDLLKNSGQARIIFLSSLLAFFNNLSVNNLQINHDSAENSKTYLFLYGNSRVGQLIISKELAERLKPYGITCNSIHPGLVKTDIFRRVSLAMHIPEILIRIMYILLYLFFPTSEEGAQDMLTMAMSHEYKNVTGRFFGCLGFEPRCTKNKEFRKEIWNKLEDLVKLSPEEKSKIHTN